MEQNINRTAASATLHCLTGCAIGEVLGMVLSTVMNWGTASSLIVSIVLAFLFGYALSMRPLFKHGLRFSQAARIAFASDTASITTMEIVDNAFVLAIPGAINASLNSVLFWASLSTSLIVAFIVAFPVNRYLILRGKGHALAHKYHATHGSHTHHHES